MENPLLSGPAWFDKKGRYSMNVQIVSDHEINIIDFSVGRTGSRCDSVAFEDTLLAKEHKNLLAAGEWCWADSGYKPQHWLVLPFTRPQKDKTRNKQFNYYLSRIRISSEHSIGWLKGCFQMLKEMRIKIKSEDDVRCACCWLRAAILLHQTAKRVEALGNKETRWLDPFYLEGAEWERNQRQDEGEQDQQGEAESGPVGTRKASG